MKYHIISLLISLFTIIPSSLSAQGRAKIDWSDFSDSIFVFEITNKEAEKFLKKGVDPNLMPKLLTRHVATFKDEWIDAPDKGHFIYATIYKNNIDFRYRPQMPFQVFLFKEYGILNLQVIDTDGNVRNDAKVRIQSGRWRFFDSHVNFDPTTKTYRIDDWSENPQRILTVELDKYKSVFNLSKDIVRPWTNWSSDHNSGPDFYSYMITDKNKYKPKEKVRFKSYALKSNKRPIKEDLEVWMNLFGFKKITTVSPYNSGGFAGEINLVDSLGLKLDKTYIIQLRDKKGRIVASTDFKYEDYELLDANIDVKIKSQHYYPDDNILDIKVFDVNELIIPDQQAQITIRNKQIKKSYTDILVVPDTIHKETIKLDNDNWTHYKIPSLLFKDTDGVYTVDVEVLTNDGQRLYRTKDVNFYTSDYSVTSDLVSDSIVFKFFEQGKEKSVLADLKMDDKPVRQIELPYSEKFDQNVQKYKIDVTNYNLSESFLPNTFKSKLSIDGGVVKDSLKFKLNNPLNLDFTWFLYEGNLLLDNGAGKSLKFDKEYIDQNTTYYLEVFYTMGGKEAVFRKTFAAQKDYLTIDTNLPDKIYPGQIIETQIKVTNNNGKAQKNVDLTAFSFNSLLDYNVPDLPYYGKMPKGREQRNSYWIEKRNTQGFLPLIENNYQFWNKIASLNKKVYYRFTFPDPLLCKDSLILNNHNIFTYTIDTPNKTTEIAPYVMKDGYSQTILYIEIDGNPVYYSWTDQPKTYSFLASKDGPHNIVIRLQDRAIIIDKFYLKEGKKTIMSLNLNNMPDSKNIKVVMMDNRSKPNWNYTFTSSEKARVSSFISEVPANNEYIYLQKDSIQYPIYHSLFGQYKSKRMIGPLQNGDYQYQSGVEYFHEGGYSYKYSKNVVYKYPITVYPEILYNYPTVNFSNLNDFYLSPSEFKYLIENSERPWFPKEIVLPKFKISTPADIHKSGVRSLLVIDKENNKVKVPVFKSSYVAVDYSYPQNLFKMKDLPYSKYDIVVLYNNGNYRKVENFSFEENTYVELNIDNYVELPQDSISSKWLEYSLSTNYGSNKEPEPQVQTKTLYASKSFVPEFNIQGTVVDNSGEPLIGCSVHIKGTSIGTVTDINGVFIVEPQGHSDILVFSYLGFITQELVATRGSDINVILKEDFQSLDEVVVVGYGSVRKSNLTGSVSSISVSSEESVETLPPPSEEVEESDDFDDEGSDTEEQLYQELRALDGLRTNFSDVGFWEPALYTDKKGMAEFTVTVPDNITQWNAVVYAMNRKLKTGTYRKSMKSYKPIMAELKTPQFLVKGDESYFATSVRNYTKEKSIVGTVAFLYESDTLQSKSIEFEASLFDQIKVKAPDADSLSTTYRFVRTDGYSDGEKRVIPIIEQGTLIAEGELDIIKNDDVKTVKAGADEETIVSISGDQLYVYVGEIKYLTSYKYACNEQLASKLIGLLNYEMYLKFMGGTFKEQKHIKEIIKRLVENQNSAKLWSWWGLDNNTSYWMSSHILNALSMAKNAGYTVNLNIAGLEETYLAVNKDREKPLSDISVFNALFNWSNNANPAYQEIIELFEDQINKTEIREDSLVSIYKKTKDIRKYASKNSYLKEKLLLAEMRQKLGLEYDKSLITKNLRQDVFGGLTLVDTLARRYWYDDIDMSNLIAYRIVRNDSVLKEKYKDPMQLYILKTKNRGWNTYQSANALKSIFPDLIADKTQKDALAKVVLSGAENKVLTEFPYTTKISNGQSLSVKKENGIPLIYTAYTIKRHKEERFGDAFEIRTSLSDSLLQKGQPVVLTVEVKVKQEHAENIMIEVPIPAGCSYTQKNQNWSNNEIHREYFKEYTAIFCSKLPKGEYTFTINLLPRYTGTYILNPAKIEMMYFPVINANNNLRSIVIE